MQPAKNVKNLTTMEFKEAFDKAHKMRTKQLQKYFNNLQGKTIEEDPFLETHKTAAFNRLQELALLKEMIEAINI